MTEAEWWACEEPFQMLGFAMSPDGLRASPRKLWLFAAACGHRNRRKLTSGEFRCLLDALEQYADGLVGVKRMSEEMGRAGYARDMLDRSPLGHDPGCFAFGEAQDIVTERSGALWLCQVLRDLFAAHLRPAAPRPAAITPIVCALAQAAYDERSLPAGYLEPARLAILADALEDAGCADAELLAHLRGPGPHVRGCWALDLVLGKE